MHALFEICLSCFRVGNSRNRLFCGDLLTPGVGVTPHSAYACREFARGSFKNLDPSSETEIMLAVRLL